MEKWALKSVLNENYHKQSFRLVSLFRHSFITFTHKSSLLCVSVSSGNQRPNTGCLSRIIPPKSNPNKTIFLILKALDFKCQIWVCHPLSLPCHNTKGIYCCLEGPFALDLKIQRNRMNGLDAWHLHCQLPFFFFWVKNG